MIKVRFAGAPDTVLSEETHDPEGNALAEPMIWVQWPDIADADLLTWDDVIEVTE